MTTAAGGPQAFDDLAISVVIPCKGSATHLQDCLDGLARQDLDRPFEVIVVDGWMDDEVAAVAQAYEFVTCLRSADNLIQARARNLGAERARSGFLAFTDCDCVPDTGWLRAAVTALDSGARLAGGPILDALPDNLFAVADNFMQFAEFPERRPEGPQAHFGGGNLALRREDFFTVGGFPDAAVGEDTLLSHAVGVRFPGDTLRFRPDMRVRHRGRETRAELLAHQRFFGLTRGELGISVSPLKHRMARRTIMLPAVVSFRLGRMLACTLRWAPQRIPTVLRALPLITWGLWHWALGFRDGSALSTRPPNANSSPHATARRRKDQPDWMAGTTVFFRDDDVADLTGSLRAVVDLLIELRVPCSYQVIPAHLDPDCAAYMRERRQAFPDLVSLSQHGWCHSHRVDGVSTYAEFAGNRPYEDQYAVLARGRRLLEDMLADDFDRTVFTPPCHEYDLNTLRAIDALGVRVFSAGNKGSRVGRAHYALGRSLRRVIWLGRKVSYHGERIPGTDLVELSGAIEVDQDVIQKGRAVAKSATDLLREFRRRRKQLGAVGFILHHEHYRHPSKVHTLRALIETLRSDSSVAFASIASIVAGLLER